jgi:plastocyanin
MEENTQGAAPRKSNMMPIIIGVLALLLLGGIALFASQNKKTSSQATNPQPTALMEEKKVAPSEVMTDEEASGTAEKSGAEKTFTVTASSFKFDPAEMKVKKGDKVTIVFKNSGGMHDWVIDEFDAGTKQLPAGGTETISFVADKVGTFEYYCSVGNHRQMGMKGTLIVE